LKFGDDTKLFEEVQRGQINYSVTSSVHECVKNQTVKTTNKIKDYRLPNIAGRAASSSS